MQSELRRRLQLHTIPTASATRTARFFQPGDPLPPNQLPGAAVNPPNEVASPTLATPYSRQASLGYSWQVNDWLGLNFEGVNIAYRDIPYRFRANSDRPGAPAAAPLPAVRQLPALGGQRQGGLQRRQPQLPRPGDRQARGPRLLHLLARDRQRARRRRRVPPDGHQLRALPARRPRRLDQSAQPAVQRLHRPAQHRRPAPAHPERRLPGARGGSTSPACSAITRRRRTPSTRPTDPNHDGFKFDLLPGGLAVNAARGHSFSQFDLRLSKVFNVGPVGARADRRGVQPVQREEPRRLHRHCSTTTATRSAPSPRPSRAIPCRASSAWPSSACGSGSRLRRPSGRRVLGGALRRPPFPLAGGHSRASRHLLLCAPPARRACSGGCSTRSGPRRPA